MSKTIAKYRGYTTSEMRTRSSIPSQSDITTDAGNMYCSNISLAAVKNILGASTYSLYDLCRHANVNKWSAFSPKLISITDNGGGRNNIIVFTTPSICKLGDFAGYNHSAIAPSYTSIGDYEKTTSSDAEDVTFQIEFNCTELILTNLNSSEGIVLTALWDGASYPAYKVVALSSLKGTASITVTVPGPTGSSTWLTPLRRYITLGLYLVNVSNDGSYSFNSSETAKFFHDLGLAPLSKSIRKIFPTDVSWQCNVNEVYYAPGYNYYNGSISAIITTDSFSTYHVCVIATQFKYNSSGNQEQVGSVITIYHGDVDRSGVNISYDFTTIWGTIPSTERWIIVEVNTHTYSASPPCGC